MAKNEFRWIGIEDGIQTGKRYDEYTEEELAILPTPPSMVRGEDYPDYYDTYAPLYWCGDRWRYIFD